MKETKFELAAKIIWDSWQGGKVLSCLPDDLVPNSRSEAYKIQSFYEIISQKGVLGWKIAATSKAGQNHIGASGPMAGRILNEKVYRFNEKIDLSNNTMSVAELEFVFEIGKTLKPNDNEYSEDEVMESVKNLYSGIEFPDSRFRNYADLGEEYLIADNACAHHFVLGSKLPDIWRSIDLSKHTVELSVMDGIKEKGVGSNVLGSPTIALTWLVNELSQNNITLYSGKMVTTGTCTVPVPVKKGDLIIADYGKLGNLEFQL